MKKLLLMSLSFGILLGYSGIEGVCSEKLTTENKAEIDKIISEYKKGNYLTSISKLREFTSKNSELAVGWYYLGNSYMNVAMTAEANEAFDKVVKLNTVPRLTSYAVQAQLCISEPIDCKYEIFDNADDVSRLVTAPKKFFESLHSESEIVEEEVPEVIEEKKKPSEVVEIEKLIDGKYAYADNIHPQAQDVILAERVNLKSAKTKAGNH